MTEPNAARKTKRPDLVARNRSRHPHPIFPLGEEAGIKHCTTCCQDKPFSEFYVDSKNDSDGRRSNCRECQIAASSRSYYKDREAIRAKCRKRDQAIRNEGYRKVAELKDVPCTDCGGRFPPYVMDFDHVRGEKVRAISSMIHRQYEWDKILAEIAKCEVVCSNCHRIRTFKRGQQYGSPPGSDKATTLITEELSLLWRRHARCLTTGRSRAASSRRPSKLPES